MPTIREVRDIPLDDLVIGKGQVRVRDVQKDIDELAESIRVQGLLQPIVVCEADKQGKYENPNWAETVPGTQTAEA